MKKILVLVLVLSFVLPLVSCFGSSTCEVHKDRDGDGYYCDECGAIFACPNHVDEDENGRCDSCEAPYECPGHADVNKDGLCDRCRAEFSCTRHIDVNGAGRCDNCKAKFICNHEDEGKDGKCDLCKAPFTCTNHKDYDADGFCNLCKGMLECGEGAHRDVDANAVCDICGDPYVCSGYLDADNDGECNECGAREDVHNKSVKPDSVVAFMRAYANSCPTKVVTETVRTVGRPDSYTLTSKTTLLSGTIAGKDAAVYEEVYQELRDVDSGAGEIVQGVFKTVETKREYIQGKGMRKTQDGKVGPWNPRETNFAPTKGSIALAITEDTIKDVSFSTENNAYVMSFKVAKANFASVFGAVDGVANVDASSDVSVVLTSNGVAITSVLITYTVSATSAVPYQSVVIKATYDYSVQVFSIN